MPGLTHGGLQRHEIIVAPKLVQHVMLQIRDDIRRLHITEFVLSGNVGDAPVNVTVTELRNGEGELCYRHKARDGTRGIWGVGEVFGVPFDVTVTRANATAAM